MDIFFYLLVPCESVEFLMLLHIVLCFLCYYINYFLIYK
jgi:hypothetical protein